MQPIVFYCNAITPTWRKLNKNKVAAKGNHNENSIYTITTQCATMPVYVLSFFHDLFAYSMYSTVYIMFSMYNTKKLYIILLVLFYKGHTYIFVEQENIV